MYEPRRALGGLTAWELERRVREALEAEDEAGALELARVVCVATESELAGMVRVIQGELCSSGV